MCEVSTFAHPNSHRDYRESVLTGLGVDWTLTSIFFTLVKFSSSHNREVSSEVIGIVGRPVHYWCSRRNTMQLQN